MELAGIVATVRPGVTRFTSLPARPSWALMLGVLLICLAKPAAADPIPFIIDHASSKVAFSVPILGVSSVDGQFRDFDGRLLLDHAIPSRSSIAFDIHTASADTGWSQRDTQLKDADLLNTARYPDMTFASTSVEPVDAEHATVHGNLTLLGVTRPIALEAKLVELTDHDGRWQVMLNATTVVNRSQFGMTSFIPIIGDAVTITIRVEATASVA